MSAWSKNGLDRLDELVARHVAVDGVPGAAWLVARDGEVHVGTAGSVDGSRAVQRDSIFRIASMTKPVTALGPQSLRRASLPATPMTRRSHAAIPATDH